MAANREELKGSTSFLILVGVALWLLDLSRDLRDMALLVTGSSRLLVYSSVFQGMHSNWGWGREGW